jgi:hypothetical protein
MRKDFQDHVEVHMRDLAPWLERTGVWSCILVHAPAQYGTKPPFDLSTNADSFVYLEVASQPPQGETGRKQRVFEDVRTALQNSFSNSMCRSVTTLQTSESELNAELEAWSKLKEGEKMDVLVSEGKSMNAAPARVIEQIWLLEMDYDRLYQKRQHLG